MNFGSDNFAGAHPDIAASLSAHASGYALPYGASDLDRTVEARLAAVFGRPLSAFYVATGTAANALALASVARPGGLVLAHGLAHAIVDECGAPEHLSGQLRMVAVPGGDDGKMDAVALRAEADRIARLDVHGGRLCAISVSQPTETGAVYSLAELDAIAAVARDHGVALHMDGARFANALASLGCEPADMTWRRGVDLLSFGGTKNGCWCAEAILVFHGDGDDENRIRERDGDIAFLRKRAGHLFSKTRFVSAQLDAYLRDGLWLRLAQHANRTAATLAGSLDRHPHARLVQRPQANEVFAVLSTTLVRRLEAAGVVFSEWPVPPGLHVDQDEQLCRFVTSFATTDEDLGQLETLLET